MCRLCGSNKAVPSKGNPVSKFNFQKDADRALCINFQNDSDIHPPFICDCCRLKLSKWRKKTNLKSKATINITLYDFKEHTDNCSVCKEFTNQSHNEEVNCDFLKSCSDFNYGFNENEKDFLVFKVAVSTEKFSQRLYIDKKSKTWQLYIHDIDVTKHSLLANVSSCLSKDSLKELLELLSRSKICPGNTGYDEICRARGGNNPAVFLSHDGKTVSAYEEVSFDHNKTVRHSNCSLLMEGTNTHMRCEKCSQFRGHLNVMSRRQEKKEETILTSSSKTRHDYLSSDQRSEKLTLLIGQKKQLKRN